MQKQAQPKWQMLLNAGKLLPEDATRLYSSVGGRNAVAQSMATLSPMRKFLTETMLEPGERPLNMLRKMMNTRQLGGDVVANKPGIGAAWGTPTPPFPEHRRSELMDAIRAAKYKLGKSGSMLKQAGVDWPTVLKMLAGGAFVGSGLGAATSFANQLSNLRQESAPDQDDKNTLYLNLPPQPDATPTKPKTRPKMASDASSASTFALGGLGAIGGTYAAYNLIRSAYQSNRKKQLEKELDQAHQIYMGKLNDTADLGKSASQFPLLSRGVGSAYLALLLTGVGSGIVANKVLNKQFPTIKPPERFGPKRIVIRTKAPGTPEEEDGEDKEASTEVEIGPDAIEALLRHCLADEKRASVSGFADLVAAVAQGRGKEVLDNISDPDTMFDLVKGASLTPVADYRRNMAITWIASEPEVGTTLAPVLAAEFQDACPGLFKLAAYVEPRLHNGLVGLVKAAVAETRKVTYAGILAQVKNANTALGMLTEKFAPKPAENLILANSLGEMLSDGEPELDRPSSSMTDSPVVKQHPEAPVQADDDQAAKFLAKHKGNLEAALAQTTV